ncbi:hypothetical protein B0J13DRAFT_569535 [Dactylonectria estremocensis]|uniref:Apple domain-containing protein n=1 Tax=Dactylonectria estremocensis TaxID=1079267 RepID=A0A9P9DGQ8_9HYPO|nr:hypothetical protein B0J13DRAFT_569535 [Dactylonectria estremocensis]
MYLAPLVAEAILLGALLPHVNAAARKYEQAREEHVQALPTPTPTQDLSGLSEGLMGLQGLDLKPRQVSSSITYTYTLAPDETCGYLSASAGAAITCENRQLCAWEVKEAGVVFCGSEVKTQCFDSSVAVDTALCSDVCQSNTFNLLCTESDAPYCRTYIYPSSVWDYRCASTSPTTPQSVDFTYESQIDPGFTTTTFVLGGSSSIPGGTTLSTDSTSSSELPTSTTIPPEATDPPKPKKKTPIGAIIGGVVGGVAVIAFIFFGILFFLRRKKPNTPPANQAPSHSQPPTNYIPGPADQYQQQQSQQQQMAMTPDGKPAIATSPVLSNWHHSAMSGPSTAISPVSQGGWAPQPFPNTAPSAPAYEAPGHEAREPTPVYEMGNDAGMRK